MSSINNLQRNYLGTGCISPRLEELVSVLKQCNPGARVLVFVVERHAVKLLLAYLQSVFGSNSSHTNNNEIFIECDMLVGQSGFDGMNWNGKHGQKEILEKFRKVDKTIRLIVCTSVLDEGLDVSSCDLVVKFGGLPSLIQCKCAGGQGQSQV